MGISTGKTTAVLAGILAVAVLAVFAAALGPRIREEWLIRRLRSEDEAVRLAAAEKLAALKSLRAVPALIEAIRGEGRERAGLWFMHRDDFRTRTWSDSSCHELTPLAFALYKIGPGRREAVEESILRLEKEAPRYRRPENSYPESVLSGILAAWDDPATPVERIEYGSE